MSRKRTIKRPAARKGIWLIVALKLFKCLLLITMGFGALSLLHDDAAAQVTEWIARLGVDPQNHFIHKLISRLWNVDDKKLEAISAGTRLVAQTEGEINDDREIHENDASFLSLWTRERAAIQKPARLYLKSTPVPRQTRSRSVATARLA